MMKNRKALTPTAKLLEAAGDYVNSIGGFAIVAGGIGIMRGDNKNKFSLVIEITGKELPRGKNGNS